MPNVVLQSSLTNPELMLYFPQSPRLENDGRDTSQFWGPTLFFPFFPGLHTQHMEVPRLGVKSELQLPASTTAHGKARDQTCVLVGPSWVHYW